MHRPYITVANGRDERIRTSGLTHPKGARYPCATSRDIAIIPRPYT